VQVADSGAVYRKYKASVEISSGGRVYTEDSGTAVLQSRISLCCSGCITLRLWLYQNDAAPCGSGSIIPDRTVLESLVAAPRFDT
jgi:hypothetical protein